MRSSLFFLSTSLRPKFIQKPFSLASRTLSSLSNHTTTHRHASHRPFWDISALYRLLARSSNKSFAERVQRTLYRFFPSQLHMVCEEAILILLRQKDYPAAASLYAHMIQRGLVPSVRLRNEILLLHAVARSAKEAEILALLDVMFMLSPGDEQLLRAAMLIVNYTTPTSLDFFPAAIAVYAQRSGPDTTISFATRSVAHNCIQDSLRREKSPIARWTRSNLAYLEEHLPALVEQFHIDMSTKDPPPPSVAVFNVMIHNLLQRNQVSRMFAFYKYVSRIPGFAPNSRTFELLFSSLSFVTHPIARDHVTRRIVTKDVLPPRVLFRHMMRQYASPTKRARLLSTGNLHAAIRAFVHRRDYAGAYIAARTFQACSLELTPKVYRTVLSYLKKRLQNALDPESEDRDDGWAYRFLGEDAPVARNEMALVGEMLSIANDSPSLQEEVKPTDVPLWDIVYGSDYVPEGGLDATPLCRLLKRALLASFPQSGDDGWGSASRYASQAIAEARHHMIVLPRGRYNRNAYIQSDLK